MISHAQRISHDREGRVHCPARGEEAAIDDVKVVDLVGTTVAVKCRCVGIVAETDSTVLVGYSSERNPLSNEEVPREQAVVAVVSVNRALEALHCAFEFANEL